jgi:CheY-like chemotaxis protein
VSVIRILLVDDDEVLRLTLGALLQAYGFDLTVAASVHEALKLISSKTFDVLLSDLHMPGAGDGLTVVSAMRHANPQAVTLLLSAFPEMEAATRAILMQADEILIKPIEIKALAGIIWQRLANTPAPARPVESVASILERSAESTIEDWFALVLKEPALMEIPMTFERRCGHLPKMFQDLVYRLRLCESLGTKNLTSVAASEHGITRRKQGYTAAMIVEESRILQVSIFQTLQNNLANIDFSVVLIGVMTIADEVDSQLSQSMKSYLAESIVDALPA